RGGGRVPLAAPRRAGAGGGGRRGAPAVAVRTLGNPPVAYHWLLEAGGAALLITAACQRGPRALETLGLGAALLLAVLSRPAQIPLLAALTVCALVAGRIELRWPLFPAAIRPLRPVRGRVRAEPPRGLAGL